MSPQAALVLRELSVRHDLYIVTGRSEVGLPLLRRWLRRHDLDERVAGVYMAPPGLRPAQHKLAVARMLSVDAHIDDDPRTAFHLAGSGVPHVYLLAHAPVHEQAPPGLQVVKSLREFADAIAARDEIPG
jgi:hypothetical protein